MGTIFEIYIEDPEGRYAEQTAAAAFNELDRLERDLSRYIENSEISRINHLPANQPLRIGHDAFECLRLSIQIGVATQGAFDITIGSLRDCWLPSSRTGAAPSPEDLNLARQRTGLHLLELDAGNHTVQVRTKHVQIDLGGIGKGYAVDRMAALLGEWGIETALIHGGYSSVLALKAPRKTQGWPISLSYTDGPGRTVTRFDLQNRAVSGSGLKKGRHVIDPRTGNPVRGRRAAWCWGRSAAVTDALATAFMVMTPDEVRRYCSRHPDTLAMIVTDAEKSNAPDGGVLRFGPWNEFPFHEA